jgi:hypothetical protein
MDGRKYAKEYRRKNRTAINAAYYRKNRKKIAKRQAAYRRKNPKKVAKQKAAYRLKNREKIAKRDAAYRFKMIARYTTMLRRHKDKLAPRGIKGVPMSLKAHQRKLYFADGRERPCWYCLGENNKTGSGLDRLDNNKTYAVKNTVPACHGCNSWRSHTHSVKATRANFKPMRDAARAA